MPRTLLAAAARRMVRAASLLVPRRHREAWLREWEAELHHEQRRLAPGFSSQLLLLQRSSGSFSDAAWLRRQFSRDAEMIHDITHVTRMLAGRPVFTIIATGVLALGLGASTAIFTVADALLLRSLPYPDADRIVALWERDTSSSAPRQEVASGNFFDWRDRATSFEKVASLAPWSVDYTGGAKPEVFFGTRVSEGFFEILGIQPLHGRLFSGADHKSGREQVAVLGHELWTTRFGQDPAIVGKTLPLDGVPVEVIGVLPAWFDLPMIAASERRDLWLPDVAPQEWARQNRTSGYWAVIAKLRRDRTRQGAQAEMNAISARMAKDYPKTNATVVAQVDPLTEHLEAKVRPALFAMLAAVALVLLIACANVANLMLARGAEREREFAIRGALGASRSRLVRQMLTESLMIAAAGTAMGLLLARTLLDTVIAMAPPEITGLQQISMDWRVFAFACALGMATAIGFGLVPALHVSRAAASDPMKEGRGATGTRRARRTRDLLAIAEIALAMVLVVSAGLLLRSFFAIMRVDTGFAADRVAAVQLFAYGDRTRTAEQRIQFFRESIDRMRALPGVTHAGAVSAMPFIPANINIEAPLAVEGRADNPSDARTVFLTAASDGYFETMGIPLVSGRTFTAYDDARSAPVAIVSQSLSKRHWRDASPIGAFVNVRFTGRQIRTQIIGVVSELRHDALDQPARDELFLSQAQVGFGSMTYVLRASADPAALIEPAKQVVWALDPLQTIYDEATVPELVAATVAPRRFAMVLVAVFAAVAMLLAAAGVYGIMSFTTSQRTREMGVRLALGATRRSVSSLVVGHAIALAAIGVVLGTAGAYVAGTAIRTMLYGVSPFDPLTVGAVAALLLVTAIFAAYLPARRAGKVDPLVALRVE
ncbi:MAG: ABC transporter permease [Vicinamibacterales bacterium]